MSELITTEPTKGRQAKEASAGQAAPSGAAPKGAGVRTKDVTAASNLVRGLANPTSVIAGFDPAIQRPAPNCKMDARIKFGHDETGWAGQQPGSVMFDPLTAAPAAPGLRGGAP